MVFKSLQVLNHKPQLVGKPSDVERHSIPDDDIVIEIDGEILWRSEDGFPDTQKRSRVGN